MSQQTLSSGIDTTGTSFLDPQADFDLKTPTNALCVPLRLRNMTSNSYLTLQSPITAIVNRTYRIFVWKLGICDDQGGIAGGCRGLVERGNMTAIVILTATNDFDSKRNRMTGGIQKVKCF